MARALYGPNVTAATDTLEGVVELATTAEAAAGTSTTLAVTPAGIRAGALNTGRVLAIARNYPLS